MHTICIDSKNQSVFSISRHTLSLSEDLLSREPEVDDFDLVGVGRDAEDVLRLQVQVQDAVLVHVLHAATNLPHEVHALPLCNKNNCVVVLRNGSKVMDHSSVHSEKSGGGDKSEGVTSQRPKFSGKDCTDIFSAASTCVLVLQRQPDS